MEGESYIASLSPLVPLGRHEKKLIQKWIAIQLIQNSPISLDQMRIVIQQQLSNTPNNICTSSYTNTSCHLYYGL